MFLHVSQIKKSGPITKESDHHVLLTELSCEFTNDAWKDKV